jgi:hypothetical protein
VPKKWFVYQKGACAAILICSIKNYHVFCHISHFWKITWVEKYPSINFGRDVYVSVSVLMKWAFSFRFKGRMCRYSFVALKNYQVFCHILHFWKITWVDKSPFINFGDALNISESVMMKWAFSVRLSKESMCHYSDLCIIK